MDARTVRGRRRRGESAVRASRWSDVLRRPNSQHRERAGSADAADARPVTGDAVESVLADLAERPVPSSRHGEAFLDLVRVMARLRGPGGCPWDHEQTHRSLARHLLEEAHEVLEAIDSDDPERLREELGDLLLQVA